MHYFLVILTSGLLAGIMYAMVAIGFVLIYKASGVFNFAQGSLVLFAALSFVTLTERGLAFWLAFLVTSLVMVFAAVVIERFVLRPLVDRSPLTLFMATLGLSCVIEGLAQLLMGTDVQQQDLGLDDVPTNFLGLELSQFDLFASATAIVLVAVLSLVFGKTRVGISLRGVADDTLAAQSIGIRLPTIWRVVWSVSGVVALVAGLLWGARQGVQFSLTMVVLKAMPVLIIGGFSSFTGAIVGGLLVGASESLADIYLGPLLAGGAVCNWFAYMLAVGFLLIRPSGLFGDRSVERV